MESVAIDDSASGRVDGVSITADLRILLVEDEAIIAMTAEDMLADIGCTVVGTATTLAEALRMAEGDGFDLALLDVNLAGEDSGPVADRLKALGRPFLFTTGYGSAGMNTTHVDVPVVMKPYQISQLEEGIGAALTPPA